MPKTDSKMSAKIYDLIIPYWEVSKSEVFWQPLQQLNIMKLKWDGYSIWSSSSCLYTLITIAGSDKYISYQFNWKSVIARVIMWLH